MRSGSTTSVRESTTSRGATQHLAQRVLLQPVPYQREQGAEYALMADVPRTCHVVLSVDQLVPPPIVWEQHEIVVGELHAGSGGVHRITPGHALILPPQSNNEADCSP